MASLIQGPVGSQNYTANSRFIDGEGRIYFNPKRMDFPLITFLGINGRKAPIVGDAYGGDTKIEGKALSKRKVENAQFRIFTDSVMPSATTTTATATSSGTTLTVADASVFTPNDILFVPRTGERMLVTASNATTSLTVTRAYGTSGYALLVNDNLVRIGSAYPVNALSGTAKSTQVQEAYNYTQIFRTPAAIGRTDKDSKLNYINTSDWERLKMEAAVEHLRTQNKAFWFGVPNQGTDSGSGAYQRTTGGMFNYIQTNVMDLTAAGGQLTPQVLDSFAEQVFDLGSSQKYLFCSPRVLSRINSLQSNIIRMKPMETVYGLDLAKYVTSHGEFILVREPTFGNTSLAAQYGGTAVCVDPEQIKYAYLNNAENEWHDNIQENDRDGVKGEWLCEAGLHLANENTHGVFQGVV